jgi:hypothetical protein
MRVETRAETRAKTRAEVESCGDVEAEVIIKGITKKKTLKPKHYLSTTFLPKLPLFYFLLYLFPLTSYFSLTLPVSLLVTLLISLFISPYTFLYTSY